MFTGLIDDIGEVAAVRETATGARLSIACSYAADGIAIGASIACSGPCLTVVELDRDGQGRTVFSVEASSETMRRTTIGEWTAGTRINLERSLRIGDEIGGHLVTGHIDGVAEVAARSDEGGAAHFEFLAPPALARYIAEKGSVALDGTSLTVNGVDGARFRTTLIPHSLSVTTWQARRPGDRVNLEVDLLARYVARLAEAETE